MSDAPSLSRGKGSSGLGFPSSSSARPRGPPSESAGATSDIDEDGFADDQVPHSSRRPDAKNIPPVEDRVGRIAQRSFEDFIEK
jgi:DNA replication licensing factor MCM6